MTDLTHDELRALCAKISVIEGWQHDELVNDTLALAKATLSLLDELVEANFLLQQARPAVRNEVWQAKVEAATLKANVADCFKEHGEQQKRIATLEARVKELEEQRPRELPYQLLHGEAKHQNTILKAQVKELIKERDNAFAECRAIHKIENERAIETMALKRKQKELGGELMWLKTDVNEALEMYPTFPMDYNIRVKLRRAVKKHNAPHR